MKTLKAYKLSNRQFGLLFSALLISSTSVWAQDGVLIDYAGSTRDNSAVLDVRSSTQGFLAPRVSIPNLSAAAPVTSPANGLLVYNTNGTTGEGYYYWNGSAWTRLLSGNTTPPSGTGATSKVAFWSSPTNLSQNTDFHWDNTNIRLGIGNVAPAEKLDVTGNIKATGVVFWGNSLTRTETRDVAGIDGSAGARSGFFETSSASAAENWPTGSSGWWHLLDVRHSNSANNYAMQLAGSFFDQNLWYRKTNNNASQAWLRILNTNDIPGGVLPVGTTDQTLRHDGSNWVASSNLSNTGAQINLGQFTATNADQWPYVTWLRDTPNSWDEGLIKGNSTRGVWGREGFGIHMHSSRHFGFFSSGWDALFDVEGATGRTYIKGNTGIGTNAPGAKLHVANTSVSNWTWSSLSGSLSLELGDNNAGNVGSIKLNSYTPGQFVFIRPSNGNYHIDATTGEYFFNWDESVRGANDGKIHVANEAGGHTIELNSAGNSWFTGGNVGIGTTGPTTQLHTTGGVRFAGIGATGSNTQILTRDGSGNIAYRDAGSWTGGDNLGNHIATTTLTTATPSNYSAVTNLGYIAPIAVPQVNTGGGGFVPVLQATTLISSGYRKHINIGSYRTGSAWGGGIYLAQGGNDNYPTEYFLLGMSGAIDHSSGNIWTDGNLGVGVNPVSKLHVMGRTNIHESGAARFEGIEAATSAGGRAQLVLSSRYSDIVIGSSQSNNNHGSTLTFATYNPSNAADYRKWVVNQGNWGSRAQFLDFGYGSNIPNPHSAINSGNNTLTLDGSNRRVGIADIDPETRFHLSGEHSTTQARLTLPAGNNGGGTGDVNLQLWVSEPGITWDAGGIGTNVTNNGGTPAGFGRLNTALGQSYIRFLTNGGAMAFNTTSNAGTYYQTMYLTNGNVGIGLTNPSYKLHVNGAIRTLAINETSDVRLKKDISPLENSLSKVLDMRGVTYNWRTEEFPEMEFENDLQYGLIAQELEKIIPELISTDNNGFKSIEYSHLIPVLIEAIKEQQSTISEQTAAIETLSAQNISFEQRLNEMKAWQEAIISLKPDMRIENLKATTDNH